MGRQEQVRPLINGSLKICNERNLICGSDSPRAKPAVVQIWDIDDALSMTSSVPAHDTASSPSLQLRSSEDWKHASR
jgi:hypothetical protein